MYKFLFGLLLQAIATQAVWYDNNGNLMQPDTLITTPGIQFSPIYFFENFQSLPFNGTALVDGFAHGGTCAAAIVKSWKSEGPPPNDLDLVGITSGRCVSSMFAKEIADGQIIMSQPVSIVDDNTNTLERIVFKNYPQFKGKEGKIFQTTLKTIDFAISNLIDFAVVSFNVKAIELYNQGYTFYRMSNTTMPEGINIINVGFHDTNYQYYYMRTMRGTITKPANGTYTPKYGKAITHAIEHTSNIFSTGSPIFATSDNFTILGLTTEAGDSVNYGVDVSEFANCFRENGQFTLNAPNCLENVKLEFLSTYGEVMDGLRYIPIDGERTKPNFSEPVSLNAGNVTAEDIGVIIVMKSSGSRLFFSFVSFIWTWTLFVL